MGRLKEPSPANLICAVTFSKNFNVEEALFALQELFGEMELESDHYNFSSYTDYYQEEMGKDLEKFFISFKELIPRDRIAEIKIETNQLEEEFSIKNKRLVNLDPGYVAEAQLVLPTTKGYAHRIYLCKRIHAEVTLIYEKESFKPLPWTYPDYRSELAIEFFNRVRREYLKKLKSLKMPNKGIKLQHIRD